MLLRIEIGEQLIRYTPPGRPNRTDFATFAREVSSRRRFCRKMQDFLVISSDRLQPTDPIGMGGKQGGSIPWGGF